MTDREANRIKRRKQRRRKQFLALALLLLFICAVAGAVGSCHREAKAEKTAILEEAENYALQYDYDRAEDTLLKVKKAEKDKAVAKKMEEYDRQKAELVAVDPFETTHVFFHTLVVDPERGFSLNGDKRWDQATRGFCQWMTTVDEFNAMMQQMYDRGFVLVAMSDLYHKEVDKNGTAHFSPKEIYLPKGKKPFVLSLDDLSYYHSYDGRGCAVKLVVDEDGSPTCEYIEKDGTVVRGSYDCVPLLDDFIEAHPDFCYRGARGVIALTGYNGVLGYRTDGVYRDRENLGRDQELWLEEHPDFDWDAECAEAKKVADSMKAEGWTFASHTWGHIHIGDAGLDRVKTDTQKWKKYVVPVVGETDTIIFAFGQDLAGWNEDYTATDKFRYMKSQGFDVFCNVNGMVHSLQIGDSYVRMGRRNLDGFRLWQCVFGGSTMMDDLMDPAAVFDPKRPKDAYLYQL